MWFFWLIFGAVIGGALVVLFYELRKRDLTIQWWGWILNILGLIAFILGVQTLVASYQEMQVQAAWLGFLFFIIPTIALFVGASRSIKSRLPG